MNKKNGFTLVELLVVISIIGILTIITASTFVTAQKKGHDAQRKAELNSVAKALMMFYNDYGRFPILSKGDPDIKSLLTVSNNSFETPSFVYMKQMPKEKYLTGTGGKPFVYEVSSGGKSFNIFADLENKSDSDCNAVGWTRNSIKYCYGIASPNTTVGTTTNP